MEKSFPFPAGPIAGANREADRQTTAERELLQMLAASEEDAAAGRVTPMCETFDGIRRRLFGDSDG